MAKNLFSQFVGAWTRQMGREYAHTAYGDISGKNRIETLSDVKEIKSFPTFKNYTRLFLALFFLPVVGSLWAILKGMIRLLSKKAYSYGVFDRHLYNIDRRYSNNKRYVGTEKVELKIKRPKKELSNEEVKKYNTHSVIYIILGLIFLLLQCFIAFQSEKNSERELQDLSTYTKWHTVSITDDFTGKKTSYEMLYSTVDSVVNKKVLFMRNNGKYILLSTTSSLFDIHIKLEIKTSNGVKSFEPKSLEPASYLTPQNKSIYFPICLEIPNNLVPSKGQMQIRSKGTIYSFDLTK